MAKSSPPLFRSRPAEDRLPAREEHAGPTLPPLAVRYYRRMHLQHVYAVAVSWDNRKGRKPPAGAPPVLLRLLMAGAQVVPSEQPLDPTQRDARVTFYVTPLAKGWLRNERLEVLLDGRKVQELPLSCHVTSQKMTWFLLVMSILVPWFLLTYIKGPLVEMALPKRPMAGFNFPGEFPGKDGPMAKFLGKFKGKFPTQPPGKPPPEGQAGAPQAGAPQAGAPQAGAPQAGAPQAGASRGERLAFRTRGQILEARIKENVPAIPEVVSENAPFIGDGLLEVRDFVCKTYDFLCTESSSRPLAFYATVCLLLLTALSWWGHRTKRKRRIGAPIPIPGGTTIPLVGAL
jgi:hypothetical protein